MHSVHMCIMSLCTYHHVRASHVASTNIRRERLQADAAQGRTTRMENVYTFDEDEGDEIEHMWQEGPGEGSDELQMPLFVLDHDEVCICACMSARFLSLCYIMMSYIRMHACMYVWNYLAASSGTASLLHSRVPP
jgi:hypothetical protein